MEPNYTPTSASHHRDYNYYKPRTTVSGSIVHFVTPAVVPVVVIAGAVVIVVGM